MDIKYMEIAFELAKEALKSDDVPIGCVIVYNGEIVGKGYNTRNDSNYTVGHAEINAINEANKHLNNWVLEDCEMYVTLEPCQMCAGAILQARIKKLYFGASDYKSGCVSSIYNLLSEPRFNHQVEYVGGVMEEECSQLVKSFFKNKRAEKLNSKRDANG